MDKKQSKTALNTRMDKFLYYSKFVTLIIVAVLFIIAYSFSYRDFPVSSAYHEFADHSETSEPAEVTYPTVDILIVIDYQSRYENSAYENFNLIKPLVDNIDNVDYDLVLLNGAESSAALTSTGSSLIMRIYQNKNYDYIAALGENSADAAKEIQQLFFPKAQLLLYGMSSSQMHSALSSSYSLTKNIDGTLSVSAEMNPSAKTLLFLCDNSDYSQIITSIANNYVEENQNISSKIIYADEQTIAEITSYINKHSEQLSVFYVSLTDINSMHSEIINNLQSLTGKIIYDLSPFSEDTGIHNSLRYWTGASSESAAGYLALQPENTSPANFELIDFISLNIAAYSTEHPDSKFNNPFSFIGWCMQNAGVKDFPETLSEQFAYCSDNSLFIDKEALQPGDLIFVSTDKGVLEKNIGSIAVYVNECTVITTNKSGAMCFTKIMPDKYQAAFAHPFSQSDD